MWLGWKSGFCTLRMWPFLDRKIEIGERPSKSSVTLVRTHLFTANVCHPSDFSTRSPTRTSLGDLRMEKWCPGCQGAQPMGKKLTTASRWKPLNWRWTLKSTLGTLCTSSFVLGQRRSPANSRTMCNVYNRGQSLPIQGLPQSCLKCHNATPMWDVQWRINTVVYQQHGATPRPSSTGASEPRQAVCCLSCDLEKGEMQG